MLGGWEIGGIVNARSGVPVNVLITRPDILYRRRRRDNYFANPAAGRIAVINTPGGGNSRNIRRPDLVPGVDPFVTDGGTTFLNPAAFAIPMPGTFGNLERNSLHGPNFSQTDMIISKKFDSGRTSNVEFRVEIFNLFNTVNFSNPAGALAVGHPEQRRDGGQHAQPGRRITRPPPARSERSRARSAAPSASARAARCSSRCASTSEHTEPWGSSFRTLGFALLNPGVLRSEP